MNKRIQIFASIVSVFIIAFAAVASYLVVGKRQTGTAQTEITRAVPSLILVPAEQDNIPVGAVVSQNLTVDAKVPVSSLSLTLEFDPQFLTFSRFTVAQASFGEPRVTVSQETGSVSITILPPSLFVGYTSLGTIEFQANAPGAGKIRFSESQPPSLIAGNAVLVPQTYDATIVVE